MTRIEEIEKEAKELSDRIAMGDYHNITSFNIMLGKIKGLEFTLKILKR